MMKAASNRIHDRAQFPFSGEDPAVVTNVKQIARTFVRLQDKRHIADDDNSIRWTRTEALDLVNSVDRAIQDWSLIRQERIAQAYLLSMIVKKRD